MFRNDLLEMLHQGLIDMGSPQDRYAEEQLIRYIQHIDKWNDLFKLTNIRNIDAMIKRHLLDSLSISPYIDGQTILDVGSGAGLPGIPLAIVMPERHFVLIDSNLKKIRFLQQTVYQMRLKNVHVVHQRVEEHNVSHLFDTIVSRAFGTLCSCIAQSQHLLKPGGQMLIMKGVYPLTEMQDIPAPFKLVEIYPLKVPSWDAERHLVELRYQPD